MLPKRNVYPRYEPEGVKIAEKIIKVLFLGLAVPAFLASPFGLYYLAKGAMRYYFRKSDFRREIKRLQKKGYVALTKTPDGWMIRLLRKGKQRYRRIQFENLKLSSGKVWDKKWRLFVFDIPEKQRILRDLLRRKLKRLGLHNIQRSVFVYPYNCRKELEFISEYYGLTKYTSYFEASVTDLDKELRQHFKPS